VVTDALVTRVILEKEQGERDVNARGVEFMSGSIVHEVHARKEVILSAG
jgi:hypothetical protein